MLDEWYECDYVLKEDLWLVEVFVCCGIIDLLFVLIDVWGYCGWFVLECYCDWWVGWIDVWFCSELGLNLYVNLVNGLHCIVDFNVMELFEIEDFFEVEWLQIMGEYVLWFVFGLQLWIDLKLLHIY